MVDKNLAIDIADKTNFLNKDVRFLKNIPIYEFDIKSAGFSVIKFLKLMPEDEIKKLEEMPKEERNVYIGKRIIKEPIINEKILETLGKVRKAFVILNKIYPEEILSIKKDAIFLIKKIPENTLIKDFFLFRKKGSYTSYLYLNRKEFFYDSSSNVLDVKGISEEIRNCSEPNLLDEIRKIMRSAERLNPDQLYQYLKSFRSKYLNRKLPKECYRSIDTGKFHLEGFELENIGDEDVEDIDISQNYIAYILPIFSYLL